MPKFLVDENLPRSTAATLTSIGHQALDVRDRGLRGAGDPAIFAFAQQEQAILITADLGFGNVLNFPLGSHAGIVIVHFPNEVSTEEINRQIVQALSGSSEDLSQGNLIIIEPGMIRIRSRSGTTLGIFSK